MKKIIVFILLIMAFSVHGKALSENDIYDFSEADKIIAALPEEMDKNIASDFINEGSPDLIFTSTADEVIRSLKSAFSDNMKFFAGLLSILLLAGIMRRINESFKTDTYKKAFDYLYLSCLAVYILGYISSSAGLSFLAIENTSLFMASSLPVLTILWSLGGNAVTAASNGAFLMFTIGIMENIISKAIIPITRVLFLFSVITSMGDIPIKKLSSFIKKTTKILIVFLFTVLNAILFFNTQLSGAKDSVASRGVRFAAGNFIPIVGNLVSESSRSLYSMLGYMKTKCGILCVFAVIITVSMPIISLFIKKIFLSFSSAAASFLGLNEGENLINEISGIFDILIAMISSSAVFFIIFLTLFTKTSAVQL